MIQGHAEEAFRPVADALARILRGGGGAAVCVYHRGRKVVDLWGGTRDEAGHAWEEDTMAMSFSTSKGVVSTLVHQLADRGLLAFDDPVARHWPEFAQAGKARITVGDVLTHRAGLWDIRSLIDDGIRILDWDHMVRALAAARPRFVPGGGSAYHALTYGWLAGEIVQRVAKRPLPDVIRTELSEPLGLDGLFIGAPAEARARAAQLRRPVRPRLPRIPREAIAWGANAWLDAASGVARALRSPFDPARARDALMVPGRPGLLFEARALDVPIPAANGLFTARSLARVYAAISTGGTLDGVRILSPRAVLRLSEVRHRGADGVLLVPMHWRLGYHGAYSSRGRIATAFGHFGYGGSGAFADPARELAVAMVNNTAGGSPFGDARISAVADAALRGAQRTRGHRGQPRADAAFHAA